jgi:hypothetical protein
LSKNSSIRFHISGAMNPGLPLKQPERMSEKAASVILPVGEHAARFGCRDATQLPVRVRITLQPPERHEMPGQK